MSANNSANSSRRGSEGTCSTISSDDVDVDLLSDETLEIVEPYIDEIIDYVDTVHTYWTEKVDWYPGTRRYSRRELLLDSFVNGAGLLIGAVMLTALVMRAPSEHVASVLVYACCIETMLIASAVYNALAWVHLTSGPTAIRVLKLVDHAGILLAIVGSFVTPLATIGSQGQHVLTSMWTAAALSITHKTLWPSELSLMQLVFFVALGWAPLFMWRELSGALSNDAKDYILVAGLSYTAGIIPLALHRLEGHTALWHLFVMAGTACSFCAHWVMVNDAAAAAAAATMNAAAHSKPAGIGLSGMLSWLFV